MAIVGGNYTYEDGFLNSTWHPSTSEDYNNAMMRGREAERAISIGYFHTQAGLNFEHGAGIRVQGSDYTRSFMRRSDDWNSDLTKFGLKLYFRGVYGPEKLEQPLFTEPAANTFDKLVLRSGRSDFQNPFIKDELTRRIYLDMGNVASRGLNVNLLINNEYKGYYNLVEKYDQDFMQNHFESDEDWDIVGNFEPSEDTTTAWNTLGTYAESTNDTSEEFFENISLQINIENFIDYIILETSFANTDWVPNNWIAVRERTEGSLFYFLPWDMERSMLISYMDINIFIDGIDKIAGLNHQSDFISLFYQHLKASESFKTIFEERINIHFGASGSLNQSNLLFRFNELRNDMAGVLPNMDTRIPDIWIPQREAIYFQQLLGEGLITE